jgi:ATP-dependent exoDNAse (exonuclease V) beta subunit
MTIHRSKGLEFPVVCVADLGRQVMPRSGLLVNVGRDGQSLGLRLKRAGYGRPINALAYDELRVAERERELAEERRLFYVAMTRAQERLIVSGAARLDSWEERNRLAPIGWVGAAFVPDIEARAASAVAVAGQGLVAEPFVTDLGVRVRFLVDPKVEPATVAPRPRSLAEPGPAPVTSGAGRLELDRAGAGGVADSPDQEAPQRLSLAPAPLDPHRLPAVRTLSYTALASYDQCAYRYYVQRVLGLPDLPTPVYGPPAEELRLGAPATAAASRIAAATAAAAAASGRPPRVAISGAQRGILIHQLLAGIDFRAPALRDSMPADVRGLLAALVGSSTFGRLSTLRDVSREQRFAFMVRDTLITGVFDVIAQDRPGHLLVIDYKSDRLVGVDPEEIVASRYGAQRMIYALAALKLGAPAVEVVHLFLEAPQQPVSASFLEDDIATLEAALGARVDALAASGPEDFRVTERPGRRVCDGCPAQDGLCSYPPALTAR